VPFVSFSNRVPGYAQNIDEAGEGQTDRPLVRVRLVIAYDGTNFRGLAPNPGVRTVVGELVRVLTPLLKSEPNIVMSGRTDAGVHAWTQVLSFDAPADIETDRIKNAIDSRLGPEVVARDVERVAPEFSARFDATGRKYRYHIYNNPNPSPFEAQTSWWVSEPLRLELMQLACDPLLGTHDFTSFCRRPKRDGEPASLIRRIESAAWTRLDEDNLRFEIAGSSFCHQMVRSIVGFHVAVGRRKRTAGEILAVLRAKDRNAAENPAPPEGLMLWDVTY
jgi:tRNA pseudouridine38-40 synthase